MSYMILNPKITAMYFQELEVFDIVILLLNICHSKLNYERRCFVHLDVYQIYITAKNWKPKSFNLGE